MPEMIMMTPVFVRDEGLFGQARNRDLQSGMIFHPRHAHVVLPPPIFVELCFRNRMALTRVSRIVHALVVDGATGAQPFQVRAAAGITFATPFVAYVPTFVQPRARVALRPISQFAHARMIINARKIVRGEVLTDGGIACDDRSLAMFPTVHPTTRPIASVFHRRIFDALVTIARFVMTTSPTLQKSRILHHRFVKRRVLPFSSHIHTDMVAGISEEKVDPNSQMM